MVAYIASLSVLVVMIGFLFGVRTGILATLFAHPIAAAGWYANYFIGPIKINPLVAIGLIVPVFVILRGVTKGPSFLKMPLAGIWIIYVCYNVFFGTFHALDEGPGRALNLIFRHLAGFVGFYMLQAFFTDRENFKRLLWALVASGFFPVGVILYQVATGSGTLRELSSGGDLRLDMAMGLTRYSGFFHDIVSVRGYVFQCLAGIVLMWAYFLRPKRDIFLKAVFSILGVACIFVLYKMYSKAALGTLIMWFVIWCIGYRKLGFGLLLVFLVVAVNAVQSDLVFRETEQLFQTEISSATSGSSGPSREQLFQGRVGLWEAELKEFAKAPVIEQFFGFRTASGAHNDYLQKLFYGGFIGLAIYVVLLWKIGIRVVKLNLRRTSPINLMAAMIFCGWIIDTIGVVPSLYPGYQWYAWGLIGLAIKGLDFEKESRTRMLDQNSDRPMELHRA